MRSFVLLFFVICVFDSCENSNLLPPGKLTSNVWKCFSQLSNLYAINGLSVQTSLKFTGDSEIGSVEIYEGTEDSKSCVSYGKYKLSNDKLSLEISNIENPNCPWMRKFNGLFTYEKGEKTFGFTKGDIKILILK